MKVVLVAVAAVLVVGLVVGAVGWSQGWFGWRLKPVAGQVMPESFGRGNIKWGEDTRGTTLIGHYRTPEGKLFVMSLNTDPRMKVADFAARQKESSTQRDGEVYCFEISQEKPNYCRMQLDGGHLNMFPDFTDGFTVGETASIMRDFYAQMKQ